MRARRFVVIMSLLSSTAAFYPSGTARAALDNCPLNDGTLCSVGCPGNPTFYCDYLYHHFGCETANATCLGVDYYQCGLDPISWTLG